MELKQGFSRLSQQLRMTPQLQQAIKLLQLSRLELEATITKEMEENPVLEEAGEVSEDEAAAKEAENLDMAGQTPTRSAPAADDNKKEEFEWENYVEDNYKQTAGQGAIRNTEEVHNYENMITRHESLQEYLLWQLKLSGFNEEEERIGTKIIGNIDDDGYIKTPLSEICPEENLPEKEIEDTLKLIHEFDPPGVGARTLQECLLVQAKVLGEDTTDVVNIITNHMKDLEKKNFEEGIAESYRCKQLEEVIKRSAKLSSTWNPSLVAVSASAETQCTSYARRLRFIKSLRNTSFHSTRTACRALKSAIFIKMFCREKNQVP